MLVLRTLIASRNIAMKSIIQILLSNIYAWVVCYDLDGVETEWSVSVRQNRQKNMFKIVGFCKRPVPLFFA